MRMSAGSPHEFSPFRLSVLILLIAIAVLQFLILRRISAPIVTQQALDELKNPQEEQVLEASIPLVRIYGTADVQGTVDVGTIDSEVEVSVSNEPLQVRFGEYE